MNQAKDLAIHPALWGYDHGIQNRKPFQVIRVQEGGCSAEEVKTKSARKKADQSTGEAGPPWSNAELRITGVPSSSLCVVVGLLIPSDAVDGLKIDKDANGEAATKKYAEKNAVKKSAEDVEIDEIAQIVDTVPGTSYLVRPLKAERTTLFILGGKSEKGLSSITVNADENEPYAVVFKEFMTGVMNTKETERYDEALKKATTFCTEYLKEHRDDFTDVNDSSTLLKEIGGEIWKNHSHPAVRLRMNLERSLVMYATSRDKSWLAHIKMQLSRVDAKF
ncbi:hypothetical protein DER45DRAFT_137445 [Fusarium avenaceum]|nr:hypothetical protein DER45DRAFT_137445 [Fusarium avenaceum]